LNLSRIDQIKNEMIEFNKFIIKPKSSWFKMEYFFCDEYENVIYRTKTKRFGRHRDILNTQGIPICMVRTKSRGFKTLFQIIKNEQIQAIVRSKSAFATSKFIIESNTQNLRIKVENRFKTFTIYKDDSEIAQCNTKKNGWFKYELGIAMRKEEDPVLLMSIIMILDVIKRMRQAAGAA